MDTFLRDIPGGVVVDSRDGTDSCYGWRDIRASCQLEIRETDRTIKNDSAKFKELGVAEFLPVYSDCCSYDPLFLRLPRHRFIFRKVHVLLVRAQLWKCPGRVRY
ncbi:hypothetical protein PFISCL1PPCAC_14255, partial [Pristionchus fissidentatus]